MFISPLPMPDVQFMSRDPWLVLQTEQKVAVRLFVVRGKFKRLFVMRKRIIDLSQVSKGVAEVVMQDRVIGFKE